MENIHSALSYINTEPFLLFFGGFFLVLGFSCFFARKAWEDFILLFIQYDALSLVLGVLTLPISLAIIAFYNDWETLASTILMVIGWLGLFKSIALLMKPSLMQAVVKKEFVRKWLWLDGFSGIILGVAMLIL